MIANVIAAGILAVCVILVVGFLIRRHRKAALTGESPGCVGCSGCSGCSCNSYVPDNKNQVQK